MEASKCPKCGDEPHFVEQVEKWYCYGCNSYVEDEEHHAECEPEQATPSIVKAEEIAEELKSLEAEDQPTCVKCGATLEKNLDGILSCRICESPPASAPSPDAPKVENDAGQNEAQALIDSITVAPPVEPILDHAPSMEPEPKKEHIPEIKMCPSCGQPLKHIEKYQRYYCYACRKYAPRESLDRPAPPAKIDTHAAKKCPDCGKELKFVEKYSEFYCFSCKKYPLKERGKRKNLKCPKCGVPLKYVEKYSRHYCLACKEYAPKGYGQGPSEKKVCPCCSEQMRFVAEYNEWYCYKCKKYSLRPSKPVLLI